MWEEVREKFVKYPSRRKVAKKMRELGFRVGVDKNIYCGNVRIPVSSIADAIDVDIRSVKSTVDFILTDELLANVYKNIHPAGTLIKDIAKYLGLGVLEIKANSENTGLLADITTLIAKQNIDIRQAYAEDNDTIGGDSPTLVIITGGPVSGELIEDLLKIRGVLQISTFN